MARLILLTAEGQQAIELRAVNSLGRHPDNTIQLLDKIVSKEHCIIEQRGEQFILRDLGSLNGTFINGERVRGEAPLSNGDELSLGATRGRFEEGPPMARPIPSSPPSGWGAQVPPPRSSSPSSAQIAGPAVPTPPPTAPGVAHRIAAPPLPPDLRGPAGAPLAPLGVVRRVGGHTSFLAQGTRVDLNDQARQIGTQIAATDKGFLSFDRIASDPAQLRADYERLRLSHELSREIALERDMTRLLDKILASVFKFIPADRGVIFLRDESGELTPRASQRRDGSEAPITVSSTILTHVVQERAAVLTHDAAMDFAGSKGKSMILNRISSAMVAPLLHGSDVLGVLWLDSQTLAQFQPKDLELVSAVANQAAMFIEINILGRKVENEIVARERFSRLLSPNVAERVLSGSLEVKPGGQRVDECTVFNSDIRGFTQMSELTTPEMLVEMLNEYFEDMVDTIFKFEGTLDKFMGDGIMALWGAPVTHADDAVRSVECALEMGDVLARFNARRLQKKLTPLAVGIGIHTGPLVAGYIGSSKALSYTVIGDVANTSARLCSVALPGQIVISETTFAKIGGRFVVDELEPARVKGKQKPLRVFNVLRRSVAQQVPELIDGDDVLLIEPTSDA